MVVIIGVSVILHIALISEVVKLIYQEKVPFHFNWLAISLLLNLIFLVLGIVHVYVPLEHIVKYKVIENYLMAISYIYYILFFTRHNMIFLNKTHEKLLVSVVFIIISQLLVSGLNYFIPSDSITSKMLSSLSGTVIFIVPIIYYVYLTICYKNSWSKLRYCFRLVYVLLACLLLLFTFIFAFQLSQVFLFLYYLIDIAFISCLIYHVTVNKGRYLNDY
jgi:hypothetical protein